MEEAVGSRGPRGFRCLVFVPAVASGSYILFLCLVFSSVS